MIDDNVIKNIKRLQRQINGNILIFVYGSLMQGKSNHNAFLRNAKFVDFATTKGTLYDLGGFPAMVDGTNTIVGEVYQITQEELEDINRLEGYDIHSDSGLYIRRKRKVYMAYGKSYRIYCYVWGRDLKSISHMPVIESGVRWKKAK